MWFWKRHSSDAWIILEFDVMTGRLITKSWTSLLYLVIIDDKQGILQSKVCSYMVQDGRTNNINKHSTHCFVPHAIKAVLGIIQVLHHSSEYIDHH